MFRIATTAAALALGATAASGAVLDFTASGFAASGTVGGVGYDVTTMGGALDRTQAYDGGTPLPSNAFGLAFDQDGAGVDGDEITSTGGNMMTVSQSIIVTFDRAVNLLGFGFLDLFTDADADDDDDDDDDEVAVLTVDGTDVFELFSIEPFSPSNAAGYAERTGLSMMGTEFAFTVRDGNDSVGDPDAALAAIEFAPVPVPAAGLLLMGALGGLGLMRRRNG